MRQGLDFAWHNALNAPDILSEGYDFACRYLSHDPSKDISPDEVAQLSSAGVDIVLVWETSANRALAGGAAGLADAQEALGRSMALGMPAGRPVYFAVDVDAGYRDEPSIDEYFKAVNSVFGLHRTGVYGGLWVVSRLLDAGLVAYAWQTTAWSGGKWDARAQLQQLEGISLPAAGIPDADKDHAMVDDFGQWRVGAPAPDPGPAPVPFPYGDRELVYHWYQRDMQGNDVLWTQLQLDKLKVFPKGVTSIATDSDYGYRTMDAVRLFQYRYMDGKDKPDMIDGVVGPLTWLALRKATNNL